VTERGGDASEIPQPPQNFSPDSFAKPHEGQSIARAAPHSAQKRRPGRFSAWQPEHFNNDGYLDDYCPRVACRPTVWRRITATTSLSLGGDSLGGNARPTRDGALRPPLIGYGEKHLDTVPLCPLESGV
jgi:hypothetical protein